MNDRSSLPLHALPDGEAELTVVLRLRWEDVAALGHEAARLAARQQRPVSLDEAASHRLRTRSAHAAPPADRTSPAAAPPPPVALAGRAPADRTRQAIEKTTSRPETPAAPSAAVPAPTADPAPVGVANGTERATANGTERPGRHPSAMIGGDAPRTAD